MQITTYRRELEADVDVVQRAFRILADVIALSSFSFYFVFVFSLGAVM